MEAMSAIHIRDVYEKLKEFDVVGIDEGQFVSMFFVLETVLVR